MISLFTVGLGCSFLTPNCDTWPYSCSTGVSGCSYDYQAEVHTIAVFYIISFLQSVCRSSFFFDDCNNSIPLSNGYCNSPEGIYI